MSVLKVAQIGHPALRSSARAVSAEQLASPGFQRLIDDLVDTMREYAGVGIAAPQVREEFRVFAMEVVASPRYPDRDELPLQVIVNPVVRPLDDRRALGWEGCLSIAGLRGLVERNVAVRVDGLTREGEPLRLDLEGFPAIVCQHEADHLDGTVYLDRMTDLRMLMAEEEYQRRVLHPLEPIGGGDD